MKTFLYGDEQYLVSEQISNAKKSFLENNSELAIEEFKAEQPIEKFIDGIFSPNLFFGKKLIFFHGLPNVREDYFKQFKKLISQELDHDVYFVVKGSPDKRKKVYKLLSSVCKTSEFKKFEVWHRDKLLQALIKMEKTRGYSINSQAVEFLVDHVGYDLCLLRSNLDRIEISILPDKEIKKEDILKYAAAGDTSVFDFLEDIRKKRFKKVFTYLGEMKKPEEAFMLLGMICSHLRLLAILKTSLSKNPNDVAKNVGKSPYYLRQIMGDVGKWSVSELEKLISNLFEADYKAKSGQIDVLKGMELAFAGIKK